MSYHWTEIERDVFLFRDSCNVYAVKGPKGLAVINAGTGEAAEYLDELGAGPVTVLLTHHFRDHSDGALRFKQRNARIMANYWDQDYYLDPEQHFRERQIWNSYDNRWDHFAPVRPIPVDGWLMDYDRPSMAGLEWEIVPTPCATTGASSYIVTFGTRRLAFVGELTSGGGKVARLAPLQYDYNDLRGGIQVYQSSLRVQEACPDRLLPSLGDPIDDPVFDLSALRENLRAYGDIAEPLFSNLLANPPEDDLAEVAPRVFHATNTILANTHFVIGGSGKILALDYGYSTSYMSAMPGKFHPSNRRPMLYATKALRERFGTDRIDSVLISHYHDDHVNGIPMLQRVYGTEVLAGEHFSDILERPERYDRPCLWREPIRVERKIPSGQTVHWDDVAITLYPMSGHTRFSTLICLEVDGARIAHTGDQIFFNGPSGLKYDPAATFFPNHVYKNGLDLGCYMELLGHLKKFQPEIVLSGHMPAYRTSEAWLETLEKGARAWDDRHKRLMRLDDDDVHFGPESQPAKITPYRIHLPAGGACRLDGWVINPFPGRETALLSLTVPERWKSESVEIDLAPREKKTFEISLWVPEDIRVRRQPIALNLTVGDRPFGQVTEALVTAGETMF